MFDAEAAVAILKPLCDKFEVRLQALKELNERAVKTAADKPRLSDEKIAKKLNKRFNKMNKYIIKREKKQADKQAELLNSNHLNKLEKDLVQSAKLLVQDDQNLLMELGEMVDMAVAEEETDKLEFCNKILQLMITSTENALNIYQNQLEFIHEVFKESLENEE